MRAVSYSYLSPAYPGLQVQLPPESPPIQTPPLRHSVFALHATGGKRHLLDTQTHFLKEAFDSRASANDYF